MCFLNLTDLVMNILITGDQMDFGQRKGVCVGEQVRLTLEMLEIHGGPNALKAIKLVIPTCKFISVFLLLSVAIFVSWRVIVIL